MTANHDLTGKTIVVTGATSGIGRAAVRELAGRGAWVLGVGRSPERCREARDAILAEHPDARLAFAVADLSSLRQVRKLACEIRERVLAEGGGKIDVLINNAGMQIVDSLVNTSIADGERLIELNLMVPLRMSKAVLPDMMQRRHGAIVDIASMAGIMPA